LQQVTKNAVGIGLCLLPYSVEIETERANQRPQASFFLPSRRKVFVNVDVTLDDDGHIFHHHDGDGDDGDDMTMPQWRSKWTSIVLGRGCCNETADKQLFKSSITCQSTRHSSK
jgi:hypothetical protein